MEKKIVNQVQEAQRVLYRINPRKNMQRQSYDLDVNLGNGDESEAVGP